MERYKHNDGLSLVEILVVVGAIAILATMLIGIASRINDQTKEKGLESTFSLLELALQEYHEVTSKFPEQLEKNFTNAPMHSEYLYRELNLVPESRMILGKITKLMVKNEYGTVDTPPEIYDPWGTAIDYIYVPGENFPEFISAGPDKIFGTADDMSNK